MASGRKRLIMEDFYRQGRKRFNNSTSGNQPIGGRWNFDKQNRKTTKRQTDLTALWFEPDSITQDVIDFIKQSEAFQEISYWQLEPFCWGVTRLVKVLQVMKFFIETRLSSFLGQHQDVMVMVNRQCGTRGFFLISILDCFIPWKLFRRHNLHI
ncbi:cryptochrome/photolyase family protein [Nostoc sp.]